MRVVEDYCRFVLDDAFLSGEWKRLRHDLAAALAGLPAEHLLAARETQRDVGAGISTEAEGERESLAAVATANGKRVQEALRSLEEFGKVRDPDLGRALEQLRYRSYTLERAAGLGAAARDRLTDVRLCLLLTAAHCAGSPEWTIRETAAGGAGMIQLREKELSDRELLERAREVRRWTREAGVLFIVNDRPDVARLVEADGVHLGQDDLPVKERGAPGAGRPGRRQHAQRRAAAAGGAGRGELSWRGADVSVADEAFCGAGGAGICARGVGRDGAAGVRDRRREPRHGRRGGGGRGAAGGGQRGGLPGGRPAGRVGGAGAGAGGSAVGERPA